MLSIRVCSVGFFFCWLEFKEEVTFSVSRSVSRFQPSVPLLTQLLISSVLFWSILTFLFCVSSSIWTLFCWWQDLFLFSLLLSFHSLISILLLVSFLSILPKINSLQFSFLARTHSCLDFLLVILRAFRFICNCDFLQSCLL